MGLHRDIYASPRWRKLRRQAWARDRGLCVQCRKQGIIKAGRQIDHIVAISDDPSKTWLISNLQTLCARHHSLKTAAEVWHRKNEDAEHGYRCKHGYTRGSRNDSGDLICCR